MHRLRTENGRPAKAARSIPATPTPERGVRRRGAYPTAPDDAVSFQAMSAASAVRTGSSARKAVLMALANCHNHHTGRCDPHVETLAYETELSERTVRDALKQLVDAGHLTRERKRRKDGALGGYCYTLTFLPADAASPPADAAGGLPADAAAPNREPEVLNRRAEANASTLAQPADHAPPLLKIEGRNLAYDVLDELTVNPGAGAIAAALNGRRGVPGIRTRYWLEWSTRLGYADASHEAFERALAAEIRARCEMYRRVMFGIHLTATALAKWWDALPGMKPPGAGLSAEELAAMEP